jgi:hypothetical protein
MSTTQENSPKSSHMNQIENENILLGNVDEEKQADEEVVAFLRWLDKQQGGVSSNNYSNVTSGC